MASWTTYKGLDVPDTPTGDAGINLKDDLQIAVDRAPYLSTSDPTSGDDSGDGFEPGSTWLNTSNNVMWSCIDATVGAAVWRSLFQRLADILVLCPSDSSGQRGIQSDASGNSRGSDAVDFQSVRASSAQVASGHRSFIGAGANNTASGLNSLASGNEATASGDSSRAEGNKTIASGVASHAEGGTAGYYSSNASGDYSHVECSDSIASGLASHSEGLRCTASGVASHAAGSTCVASGDYSHVGGEWAIASHYGQMARGASRYSRDGDTQTSLYTLRCQTTNATQTELFLDGSAARMTIDTDSSWVFVVQLTARRSDANNESAAWEIKGCIDNNAGTTALVGTVTSTTLGDDSGGTWAVTVDADNTSDALRIRVTGEASKTILWVASVVTVECRA